MLLNNASFAPDQAGWQRIRHRLMHSYIFQSHDHQLQRCSSSSTLAFEIILFIRASHCTTSWSIIQYIESLLLMPSRNSQFYFIRSSIESLVFCYIYAAIAHGEAHSKCEHTHESSCYLTTFQPRTSNSTYIKKWPFALFAARYAQSSHCTLFANWLNHL